MIDNTNSKEEEASARYRRESLACKDSFSSREPTGIPCTVGSSQIRIAKDSKASSKRPGERGHPYLTPLARGKEAEKPPFVLNLIVGWAYSKWIEENNLRPKPKLSKTTPKYPHSTESNAFSASRDTTPFHGQSRVAKPYGCTIHRYFNVHA